MSYAANARTDRINIRVRPALKRVLRQAASATDKTISEFLLEVGLARAMEVLADRSHEYLTRANGAVDSLGTPIAPDCEVKFRGPER